MADDLDRVLKDLLKNDPPRGVYLADDDLAFVEHICNSITGGSMGVFVVIHPDDRMQYMVLGTNRNGAIALLATVIQRLTKAHRTDEAG